MCQIGSMFCCGVFEIDGITGRYGGKPPSPVQILRAIQDHCVNEAGYVPAYIMFTAQERKKGRGTLLAAAIRRKGWGSVTLIARNGNVNGNTGNKIFMWVWTPNKKYCKSVDKIMRENVYLDCDDDYDDHF